MYTLTRSIRSAAAGMLLLSAPATAYAQAPDGAAVSSRIRVSAVSPDLNRATGTLIARDSAGLTMVRRLADAPPDTFRIAAGAITSLEVSRGRRSSVGRGALIGGLVLGGVGIAAGFAEGRSSDSYGPAPAAATVPMMAVGAGLGALIGLMTRRDRWEAVSAPDAAVR